VPAPGVAPPGRVAVAEGATAAADLGVATGPVTGGPGGEVVVVAAEVPDTPCLLAALRKPSALAVGEVGTGLPAPSPGTAALPGGAAFGDAFAAWLARVAPGPGTVPRSPVVAVALAAWAVPGWAPGELLTPAGAGAATAATGPGFRGSAERAAGALAAAARCGTPGIAAPSDAAVAVPWPASRAVVVPLIAPPAGAPGIAEDADAVSPRGAPVSRTVVAPLAVPPAGTPGITVPATGVPGPPACALVCAARTEFWLASCAYPAAPRTGCGSRPAAAGSGPLACGAARAGRGRAGACAGRR
jgi:hypothetical protein